MPVTTLSITLTQQQDYQFLIDFGGAMPGLLSDEPPPLGSGAGPAPNHLLLASIANCLSASFFFALGKFKQDAGGIRTTASCAIDRNDNNRLRIVDVAVDIRVGRPAGELAHLDRVLSQFEEFCTVTQSVQSGIPVRVSVFDGNGAQLK